MSEAKLGAVTMMTITVMVAVGLFIGSVGVGGSISGGAELADAAVYSLMQ
jgi:hypothetical protein